MCRQHSWQWHYVMILDADPKLWRHKRQALRQNLGLCWPRCRGDLTADYQTKYSESDFERNTQANSQSSQTSVSIWSNQSTNLVKPVCQSGQQKNKTTTLPTDSLTIDFTPLSASDAVLEIWNIISFICDYLHTADTQFMSLYSQQMKTDTCMVNVTTINLQ